MQTMSLTGESDGRPIPGVDPTTVLYLGLLPNLLVSAHPDYVMTHRMVPLAPGRTWVECSWYVPGRRRVEPVDAAYAVEFWDLTNKQDWAACESVQRGLASPHFRPGRSAQRGRGRAAGVDDRPGLPHRAAGPVSVRRGPRGLTLLAVVVALAGTLLAVVGTRPGARGARQRGGAGAGGRPHPEAAATVVRRALCGSDPAGVGARQPVGRQGEGRVRLRAGPRHARRRIGTAGARTRAGPATPPPAPASSYAAMYGAAARPAQPAARRPARHRAGPSRSTARTCRTSTIAYAVRGRPVRSPARRPRRRLHDRARRPTTSPR